MRPDGSPGNPCGGGNLPETMPVMSRHDSTGSAREAAPSAGGRPRGECRRVAILTPVLDDWTCFVSLIGDIAARFAGSGVAFDICAVDDGSVAPFDPALLTLPAESCIAGIEILRLAVNLGHQRAIAVGLCALADRDDLDAVVVMDSDGEDRPSDIAALLAASADNPGQIILARRDKRSESLAFRSCYWVYRLVFHALTGQTLNFGNFSLIPIGVVRRLVHMPELWNNLAASLIRSRLRCTAMSTARGSRYNGRSRMNLVGLIVHGLSALSVHVDTIFVRVLLASGLVAAASLIGIIAVALIRFTTDLAIPGWATTAVGDLLIILLQTVVVMIAATLMMLAGRSSRPMIPAVDSPQFIAQRERHAPAAARVAAAPLG